METVDAGFMTKDLALSAYGDKMERQHWLTTFAFLDKVKENLLVRMATVSPAVTPA